MAPKFLTIDIGNTCTSFAVFQDNKIITRENVLTTNIEGTITKFANTEFKEAIISSVVPEVNEKFLKLNPRFVSYEDFTELTSKVMNPSQIGTDILCKAKALGDEPAIIISFGTATVIVVATPTIEGVAIIPGMKMQLTSLSTGTSQLHYTEAANVKGLVGKNTKDAVISGVVLSQAFSTNSFVEKIKKEFGDMEVIITGGYSKFLIEHLNFKFINQKNMVLNGLYKVAKGE